MTAAITIETSYRMPSPSDARAEERALVIAAQHGESEAFAQLVRQHQRRAYAVCRAIVLTHEDAEDAVQEGFLHAFKALDRFLPDQPFGAWLYRIMANASLDLVRRRKVRDADELPETIAIPFRDPGESDELRRDASVHFALWQVNPQNFPLGLDNLRPIPRFHLPHKSVR